MASDRRARPPRIASVSLRLYGNRTVQSGARSDRDARMVEAR
jgi:hypothetical protein